MLSPILLLGVLVALIWLRDVSRRINRLGAEIADLRGELARIGTVAPGTAGAGEAAPETPPAKPGKGARGRKAQQPDAASAAPAPPVKAPVPEPVATVTGAPDDRRAAAMAAAAAAARATRKGDPLTSPPAARPGRRSAADIESLVGARWSVILGGIAIALGALFLVRYSIEAGLIGPGARIALGALLSAALLGGGEWLRRHDKMLDIAAFEKADIPGIMTGAGAVAAFGTLYAAHALYGFVGTGAAFAGLTLIGLSTMALSSIHGPKLAAIGLLGAFGAPLLVDSVAPNPLALALHTLAVTGAAMAVARLRDWLWLAIGAVAGGIIWALLAAITGDNAAAVPNVVLLVGLALIFAAGFAWELADRPDPLADRPIDWPALGAFAALAFAYAVHCASIYSFPAVAAGVMLGLVMVAVAAIWPSLSAVAFAAAFVAVIGTLSLDLALVDMPGMFGTEDFTRGLVPPDIGSYAMRAALLCVPAGALAIAGAWRAAPTAPAMAGKLAAGTSLIAVIGMIAAYLRIAPFETHTGFGLIALVLAAAFGVATEAFTRLRPGQWDAPAPASLAVAAVALFAFALGVMASNVWMPLGFALTAAGIAYVYTSRPLGALPVLAAIASVLAATALWASLPFSAETIGSTPFLNKLIILVGFPAAATLAGGEILRRDGAEKWGAVVTAVGLALLALFVALELRHWISGGDIAGAEFGLADMAVQTLAALGFAIGLQRVARFTRAYVYDIASLAAGALGAAMIGLGLFLVHNPLLTDDSVGVGKLFNLLMPGYLLTGLLAGAVALLARPVRPRWYTLSYAFIGAILLFLYFTLMTRHAFQTGGEIGLFNSTSDGEFWTYSAVWLILGGLLLASGLFFRSLPLRIASAAMIGLTICKVFLLDMAALTGALRAFSFIGLGISLLIIGRFYQRILTRTGNAPAPEGDGQDTGDGGEKTPG